MNNSDLDVIAPVAKGLAIAGATLEISPLRIGQLPQFMRAIQPCLAGFNGNNFDLVILVAEHGESLAEAMAIAVGKPRDWIDGLMLDEFLALAEEVIEINADFFIQRVLPQIQAASARMQQLAGRTSFTH